ncbi:MAG: hypothetical protein ACPGED_10735, partial [Flavobacteriales bacterium]
TTNLEALFNAHVQAVQACRLMISSSLSVPLIVEKANEMCAYQLSFERIFTEIVTPMNLPKAETPLQADQIDLGKTLYKVHNSIPIENELAKEFARIAAIST